jgi:hypothetical protein
MGLETPLTDEAIDSAQTVCPRLGVSPPYIRRSRPIQPAMSHKEIAEVMGCSRQAVANIEKSALEKLAMMI